MLNREPMGMKPNGVCGGCSRESVSVLNREPMGMKRCQVVPRRRSRPDVSVLNREPMGMKRGMASWQNSQ